MTTVHYVLIIGAVVLVVSTIWRHLWKMMKAAEEMPWHLDRQWARGSDLRQTLAGAGYNLSCASFYMLMSKLVDEGRAEKRDTTEVIDAEIIHLRWFRATELNDELLRKSSVKPSHTAQKA